MTARRHRPETGGLIMQRLLTVLIFSLFATGALAQIGPSTMARNCSADQALVKTHGAIVMSTGPRDYDRYVLDDGYCQADHETVPASVPSLNTLHCFVGYVCGSRT
jgi:hypothetical protein